MILSMTGYGQAEARESGVSYRVEVRSVNNRYFKATIKMPEQFQRFETDIDKQLRASLGRGSLTYSLRVKDENAPAAMEINAATLARYVGQLEDVAKRHKTAQIDLASLLDVPGVCEQSEVDEAVLNAQFAVVRRLTGEAIERVQEMRRIEGLAMLQDLQTHCDGIRARVAQIAQRSPAVVREYHQRLRGRVQQLMAEVSVELDQDALVREVAIFAERCDVNEELSRMASHLDQFAKFCADSDETGRKLDFLSQEMLREANTVGSKAADAEVTRQVVEIKAAIDRIKEQVQNIA